MKASLPVSNWGVSYQVLCVHDTATAHCLLGLNTDGRGCEKLDAMRTTSNAAFRQLQSDDSLWQAVVLGLHSRLMHLQDNLRHNVRLTRPGLLLSTQLRCLSVLLRLHHDSSSSRAAGNAEK